MGAIEPEFQLTEREQRLLLQEVIRANKAMQERIAQLEEGLRECADELEESVKNEGVLHSFVATAKRARALLAGSEPPKEE